MATLAITSNDNEPLIRATYGGAASWTPPATPGLIWQMRGAAGKIIRVKNLTLSGAGTAAGTMYALIKRYNLAASGGTAVPVAQGRHDAVSDVAPSASQNVFTVNPTANGLVETFHGGRIGFTTTGSVDRLNFAMSWLNDKAIILRGASDFIGIDMGGGTLPAGGIFDIDVEWTEESDSSSFTLAPTI